MKFRLMVGQYIDSHPTKTRKIDGMPEDRVYQAPAVIDTPLDLSKYNFPGMTPKFERIEEDEDPRNRRMTREDWLREQSEAASHPVVPPPTIQAPLQAPVAPAHHQSATSGGVPTAVFDAPPKTTIPSSVAHLPPPQNVGEYVARLEKMSVTELQKHAEEEEVDLKGAKTKVDIIKSIRASL